MSLLFRVGFGRCASHGVALMTDLIQVPPMSEAEVRALIANCECGDATFEAMGVRERTASDKARAKLELALIEHHASGNGMVMN